MNLKCESFDYSDLGRVNLTTASGNVKQTGEQKVSTAIEHDGRRDLLPAWRSGRTSNFYYNIL